MKIRLEIKKVGSTVLPIPPEEAPRNRANPIMEPEAIKLSIRSANNLIRNPRKDCQPLPGKFVRFEKFP